MNPLDRFKAKITGKTLDNCNTKNVQRTVSLKYLSNFGELLKCHQFIKKDNLILTCSVDFVISAVTGATKFAINDTKCYILVATLSTRVNAKLLEQLKSRFYEQLIWINTNQTPNKYLKIYTLIIWLIQVFRE